MTKGATLFALKLKQCTLASAAVNSFNRIPLNRIQPHLNFNDPITQVHLNRSQLLLKRSVRVVWTIRYPTRKIDIFRSGCYSPSEIPFSHVDSGLYLIRPIRGLPLSGSKPRRASPSQRIKFPMISRRWI